MTITMINYSTGSELATNLKSLSQLHSYLSQQQLPEKNFRELKQVFPEWITIAEDLDDYVQLGLMERYDRCYRFSIQTLSPATELSWQQETHDLLTNCQLTTNLMYVRLAQMLQEELTPTVYISDNKQALNKHVACMTSNELTWFDIVDSNEINGIASYFKSSHSQQQAVDSIRQMIGDVDQAFFLNFLEKTLLLLNEADEANIKENIFTKVLSYFDYINKNPNTNKFKLQQPIMIDAETADYLDAQQLLMKQINDYPSELKKSYVLNALIQELLVNHSNKKYVLKRNEATK